VTELSVLASRLKELRAMQSVAAQEEERMTEEELATHLRRVEVGT
jgi:hypothetical protein